LTHNKKFYIETYGCQMNVADSEVVASVMEKEDYELTGDLSSADIILVNTCSIRENAEQRVLGRLEVFRQEKKRRPALLVGVIGCMAERLKEKLLIENKVDLVIGPDAYRDLPLLVKTAGSGQPVISTLLSQEETYADISPVRYDSNGVSAFVSIMRGCNYACAYCVVPFTRGRERSRDPESIIGEIRKLAKGGYKEVTLLGQNVDKYTWYKNNEILNFAGLLENSALVDKGVRIRFSTSYPSDMTDEVLRVIAKHPNICKSIHLPLQSGSTRILKKMKRRYTRDNYIERIVSIRSIVPEVSVSTDIIAGFCSETVEDHKATLSLMEWAKFDFAYMFKYSERPGTFARKRLKDDVPDEIKSKRLTEIIDLQNRLSEQSKKADTGKIFEVLAEGVSKKSAGELFGRTSQNKVVVFPMMHYKPGDYINVRITGCTSATLIGKPVKEQGAGCRLQAVG
jgi:tRNA-2-methylthio-N6-dimethylallyladenosine synthase